MDINQLTTEQNNRDTLGISESDTLEMLQMINREDQKVALAVEKELASVAKAVDKAVQRMKRGGRMFYFGAGTSGRLGVIDASEVRCTFGATSIKAIIAGGESAVFDAARGAEDDREAGRREITANDINETDIVVGIAASGRTPYVLGALEAGKGCGAFTIGICNNKNSEMSRIADICIDPLTGPEAVEGSTRMKAGTSQKMILNMLSTGIMIKLGRVYQNRMIYMTPNNEKLKIRSERIVQNCTGCNKKQAIRALEASGYCISQAIVMLQFDCCAEKAAQLLEEFQGNISEMRKAHGLLHRN